MVGVVTDVQSVNQLIVHKLGSLSKILITHTICTVTLSVPHSVPSPFWVHGVDTDSIRISKFLRGALTAEATNLLKVFFSLVPPMQTFCTLSKMEE